MCGIIGYTGHRPAVALVVEGLKKLEYRGYDSSGIGFIQNRELNIFRAPGKLRVLEELLESVEVSLATTAVGHTRWATHGAPTVENAHPHRSEIGDLCIVHNGIIENYQEKKNELFALGCSFQSETDTEVLANMVAYEKKDGGETLEFFARALKQAEGAFAVALISKDEPDTIYAARQSAPLLLGIGVHEHFIASDVPAFLSYTREVVFLEDGEIVKITPNSWEVFSLEDLKPVKKKSQIVEWDVQSAQKGGYKHFMLKEIYEQPKAIKDCMAGRVNARTGEVVVPELERLSVPERLRIVACGTSYNAGLWAAPLFEKWAGIPVSVEIASEFRYREPILEKDETVLCISQSGETADTLAALRVAKDKGNHVIGLCNVIGSNIARVSDTVIFTQAGPEISVASTKALCSQMLVLMLMALHWGKVKETLPAEVMQEAVRGLTNLSAQLESILPSLQQKAQSLAGEYAHCKGMFFLGRGQAYPLALEGALKVKELSYIHAEGYAAGEMKHGPIALIEPDFPTFALLPHDELFAKSKSNLVEVQARHGDTIALTNPEKPGFEIGATHVWVVPEAWGPLSGFLMLPALQLFSYEAATYLGKDVDQPRNLAKSVTVE